MHPAPVPSAPNAVNDDHQERVCTLGGGTTSGRRLILTHVDVARLLALPCTLSEKRPCSSYDRAWPRIQKPVGIDNLLVVDGYAQFKKPALDDPHVKITIGSQRGCHTGSNELFGRSDRAIMDFHLRH